MIHHEAEPRTPEGRLTQAEGKTVVDGPTITSNPAAIDAYANLGVADAAQPGADQDSGPEDELAHPSADLVQSMACHPLDLLGENFAAFRAAWSDGTFGGPVRVSRMLVGLTLWWLIVLLVACVSAAAQVDIQLGAHVVELLTGAQAVVAQAVAVAVTVVVNVAAYFASGALYERDRTILARHGGRLALVVLLFIVALAICFGLVAGGYDPFMISTVTSGGANTAAAPTSNTQPLLALTYIVVILLSAAAVAVGHLLFVHLLDVRWTDRTMSSNLSDTGRLQAALAMTISYLGAVSTGHEAARQRIGAYNATFLRNCDPDVRAVLGELVYVERTPAWEMQAEAFETMLEDRLGRGPLRLIA